MLNDAMDKCVLDLALLGVDCVINDERVEEQEETGVRGPATRVEDQRRLIEVIIKDGSVLVKVLDRFIRSIHAK